MNRKILITGGAGCLGSNLVARYQELGDKILVLDNFATGKRDNLLTKFDLDIVEGSVANENCVNEVFSSFQPTHVIHSAASYKDPTNWVEDIDTNVLGSINVANASIKHDISRFINFQTALCYGIPETSSPIKETSPTAPFTSYGISKTAGEAYLMQTGLPVCSFRLANICAPGLSIGPIPTFYKRLKSNKNCFCSLTIRDFLDVEDFFLLMDLALEEAAPCGIFNVSTGEGKKIKDVYDIVAKHLRIKNREAPEIPVERDDAPYVVLDPSKTQKSFGWKASVTFEKTILNQLKWYDEYGVDEIFSHLNGNQNKIEK
ncbi:NAD-dependent epimerase/dehydratase family protein [Alphaproteobacteria bacterium]|nr:NAD-dependent epimerase/dehydratase family protein [Alphaproteobacteria bacterium]